MEKLPVEIIHPREPLESRLVRRRRKDGDGVGVLGEGQTFGGGEELTEKLKKPNCQPMLTTKEKNLAKVVDLGRKIPAEDQNIIDVDEVEQNISENLIHQALKCIPGIAESKGHPQKLKRSEGSDDSIPLNILRSHRDLIKPLL